MSTTETPRSIPTALPGFTVRVATPAEWARVTEWANREGWNHGFSDAACFLATDPHGFFLGYLGDRPVAAVSLVNHNDGYAVWGHYLVDPGFRAQGYGRATCRVARKHAGDRILASDAMPGQVTNYTRSGLVRAHDTVHYTGLPRPSGDAAAGVVPYEPAWLDAVTDYDRLSFPDGRPAFLAHWLAAEGHRTFLRVTDGVLTGYGVLRPAPLRWRIGPLVADTEQDGEALFAALTTGLGPDEEVSLFVPERQGWFAAARGLTEEFRVVRMYTAAVPEGRAERVYAIGSLELG
ncbi:hypothetical protein A4R43_01640 [Amycolatopsis albispora]|uniref:N-acetyltransferase domain-containing protein n=2 Tax=Amycolatopsis albispora TaxID=1804986 RepID=A0A344L011_9PSEU|nr:hypothetical protein A4R43_01640 [Amycolatopsis albispora]